MVQMIEAEQSMTVENDCTKFNVMLLLKIELHINLLVVWCQYELKEKLSSYYLSF